MAGYPAWRTTMFGKSSFYTLLLLLAIAVMFPGLVIAVIKGVILTALCVLVFCIVVGLFELSAASKRADSKINSMMGCAS